MASTRGLIPSLLRDIRAEIGKTNERLEATRIELAARLDQTNERLEVTRIELSGRLDRVEKRQAESEIRLATAITPMAGTLVEVRDLLKDRGDDRDRIARCEHRIDVLETRAG